MATPEAVPEHLRSEAELSTFLAQFEAATLPLTSWTHSAHVTVAASYLWQSTPEAVLPHIRTRIQTYNIAVGGKNTATTGYHESLTVFWLCAIHQFLQLNPAETRLNAVRTAVNHFGPRRDLFRDYYSFDVVNSREARASWFPPDLREL